MPAFGGIVLVGGRSTRMGADKALLEVAGEPLVVRVARVLREAGATPVVVVAAAGQALPEQLEAEVVRDLDEGRGPLEGLRTGLRSLEGRTGLAFVASVDLPALRPELVRAVVAALDREPEADAAVPVREGLPAPLAAACRLGLLDSVERLLASGERRLRAAFGRSTVIWLDAERLQADAPLRAADPELLSLVDVDTPDELAALLVRVRAEEPGRA